MSSPHQSVLVVEDDRAIRETLSDLITMEGYSVETCVHGKEALDFLYSRSCPCLILLDLMMPVMGGAEFLDRFRRERPDLASIPVVIISAAGQAATLVSQHQATGLLKKPIEIDQLLQVIEQHCNCRGP